MVEIKDLEDFENWLEGKPVEWAQVLATRIASRVFPLGGRTSQTSLLGNPNKLTLAIVRIFFICLVTHIYSLMSRRLSYVTYLAPEYVNDSAYADAASSFVAHAADAACSVNASISSPYLTSSGHAVDTLNYACQAAYEVDNGASVDFIYIALNSDIYLLEKGMPSTELLAMPLWPSNIDFPFQKNWQKLQKLLLEDDSNWQFWIDWYQALLDGSSHKGLTNNQRDELYKTIALFPNDLWEQGAETVNARIAELLEEIKDKPSIPEEKPGVHIELVEEQFEIVEPVHKNTDQFDKEDQTYLHEQLKQKLASFEQDCEKIGNQHPGLAETVKNYKNQLLKPLEALNSVEFWAHNTALLAQAKAYTNQQNANDMLTPALEPDMVAALEEISGLAGGFVLGFPEGRKMADRARQAIAGDSDQLQEPITELLKTLNKKHGLWGPRLKQLFQSFQGAIDKATWKAAYLDVSTTTTIYNVLLAVGKKVNQLDKESVKRGSGAIALGLFGASVTSVDFILLLSKMNYFSQFIAPFPELHQWITYVIERAKFLKKHFENNSPETH